MHLKTRNVNTAFRELVYGFDAGAAGMKTDPKTFDIVKEPSRNGNVLRIAEPVTITYSHPRERVLFNAARDVNPFFHLYEALWMLAGRNDVAPLAYYASKMKNFSDDGKTLNGAYGYRWRKAISLDSGSDYSRDVDQLDLIVNHLKSDPNSRRAVLQMWNVEDDLLKVGGRNEYPAKTITPPSKDVCCNLSVMFSLRGTMASFSTPRTYLDMTVTSRSEDMIWGLLGADYVDFSILQEYVAARLGVLVGVYHHFANNLHVYDWNWKPNEWLADEINEYYVREDIALPLVYSPETFEQELPRFVSSFDGVNIPTYNVGDWDEPFLRDVAAPAFRAFRKYKEKCPESAAGFASQIKSDDWRIACTNWLERRKK